MLKLYVRRVTRVNLMECCRYHRLRGSASPVLTATHHSYGSPRLSDFFSGSRLEIRPTHPTDFDAKWLKRRGFTQGWYFCSKNRYFSYPL